MHTRAVALLYIKLNFGAEMPSRICKVQKFRCAIQAQAHTVVARSGQARACTSRNIGSGRNRCNGERLSTAPIVGESLAKFVSCTRTRECLRLQLFRALDGNAACKTQIRGWIKARLR